MRTEVHVVAQCPKCGGQIMSDHILTRCMECDSPLPPEIIRALSEPSTSQYRPPAGKSPTPSAAAPAQRPANASPAPSQPRNTAATKPAAQGKRPSAPQPVKKSGTARRGRFSRTQVLSHWHTLVDDFNTSALEFYSSVEGALAERKLPDLKVRRVDWKEGGIFSAKREYLQISMGRLSYDICASPYGTGYFFSSWMAVKEPIPILDWILGFFGKRAVTYYTLDTRLMFQESVHRALTESISSIRIAQGLRALSADETRLTMRDLMR
jgi:hypothetical protein